MGVALVGGMLFATLLGIFVYPALYYFVGRIGNFERRRERKKQEENYENRIPYRNFALACAACTPRFYPPKVDVPDDYLYGEGFPRDTAALASDWWRLFGDTVLRQPRAAGAGEQPRRGRSGFARGRGAAEPRRRAGAVPAPGGHRRHGRGEYTPQTKSYRPTPSNRRSWKSRPVRAAAQRQTGSQGANRLFGMGAAGVRLSLAAEVATTYFTLLEYERDLAIARRSCTLRRESAALIDSMFRYGMSDGVALEQARSLVYAEADIPQYERAVKQTRLSLDILLGETPQAADSTGSRAAPARRPPSHRYPRGASVGTAQAAPGHPRGALQYAPGGRECRGYAGGFPSIALTTKGGIASIRSKV